MWKTYRHNNPSTSTTKDWRWANADAIEPDLNKDFEGNTPQQEGIIHEIYEWPGKEYLQESLELHTQDNSKK